ncbi:MAG TPA: hypothetical protein DEB39_08770, partial [Planctomycetaceae bacterium]|nr:hypothetical protein [Planctomycetaceae bacterium]
MYKFLLCWRYLLSRYIALASVISVMLGVATMIVVNAVMLGFTTEMQDRIHGILSDVIFESRSIDGFPDAEWHMEKIMQVAGDKIEGLTPTVVVPAMMSFQTGLNGEVASRPIELVGIDELTQSKVSQVAAYLQHAENRRQISFDLRESGYDILSQGDPDKAILRNDLRHAGWVYRRTSVAEVEKLRRQIREEEERLREQHAALQAAPPTEAGTGDGVTDGITDGVTDAATGAADPGNSPENPSENPFAVAPSKTDAENVFDPAKEQHTGAIIGIALSQYFRGDVTDPATGESRIGDSLALIPGDDITLTIPMTEIPPKLRHDRFTVVDLYESKMMEYDSRLVFVPIQKLQDLRGMVDPRTGRRMVTQILIKAKPGVNLNELRDVLQVNFPSHTYNVKTWADVQETLLAAVFMEVSILNVLLFLIIAVAG